MASEQRIVRFIGDVQGVGFRYTATRAAGDYEVTGYVRNMPDGSVECVVEGEADEIDRFLADLRQQMSRCIREVQQQTAPFSGRFRQFGVRSSQG